MSSAIDPAQFAANLRAEMASRRIGSPWIAARLTSDRDTLVKVSLTAWRVECLAEGMERPTPAEVSALATALGCTESRLTVSREEVEGELERLRLREHALICCIEEMGSVVLAESDEDSRFDRKLKAAMRLVGLEWCDELCILDWNKIEERESAEKVAELEGEVYDLPYETCESCGMKEFDESTFMDSWWWDDEGCSICPKCQPDASELAMMEANHG